MYHITGYEIVCPVPGTVVDGPFDNDNIGCVSDEVGFCQGYPYHFGCPEEETSSGGGDGSDDDDDGSPNVIKIDMLLQLTCLAGVSLIGSL